jgi:hypothetical protein
MRYTFLDIAYDVMCYIRYKNITSYTTSCTILLSSFLCFMWSDSVRAPSSARGQLDYISIAWNTDHERDFSDHEYSPPSPMATWDLVILWLVLWPTFQICMTLTSSLWTKLNIVYDIVYDIVSRYIVYDIVYDIVSLNIVYDIVYDIVSWYIVYDIAYYIVYDIVCNIQHSIRYAWTWHIAYFHMFH